MGYMNQWKLIPNRIKRVWIKEQIKIIKQLGVYDRSKITPLKGVSRYTSEVGLITLHYSYLYNKWRIQNKL